MNKEDIIQFLKKEDTNSFIVFHFDGSSVGSIFYANNSRIESIFKSLISMFFSQIRSFYLRSRSVQ